MRVYIRQLWFIAWPVIAIAGTPETTKPRAVSDRLRCDINFFEAHFNFPAGYDQRKDVWMVDEKMHRMLKKAPLASYVYFRKVESSQWHLTLLKPVRHEFSFLNRYELTFLESRLTSLGQTIYRFEHKVNHLRSVEFSLDALEPSAIFLRHDKTHDYFLHLTCVPE